MARPRTATAILEARGAFKKDPQRLRVDPVTTGELSKVPPRHLKADQKRAWRRIVKIAPAKVLQDSDEIMVELAAVLLAEFQADPAGMQTSRLLRLETQLGKLGLSPSDRARVGVEKPAAANDFDDF
jgi:phage terminase small subunit